MTTLVTMSRSLRTASAAIFIGLAACTGELRVTDPNVIDSGTLDPASDAETFALSARQSLANSYSLLIMYSGWFSGEIWEAETDAVRVEFGRRAVLPTNSWLTDDLWRPLSVARATAARLLRLLAGTPGEGTNINVARAELVSGYAFIFMAENFCQGAVDGGPPLTTADMLDSAVVHFTHAHDVGVAVTGGDAAEGAAIADAALVGRARAHLQAGDDADAATDADAVSAGFSMSLAYLGDPSSLARLANQLWVYTADRRIIAVAPDWRTLDDPRVPVNAPTPSLTPQDGVTEYWTQGKYTSYDDPIRLASKLEADYIAAEANGTAAMLALIDARRAANGLPDYSGATDDASVLTEFMEQRGRDFYLEAKRLGDMRRHPEAVLHVPVPGSAYHKAGYEPVGDETCFPLPLTETANNPNFSRRGR